MKHFILMCLWVMFLVITTFSYLGFIVFIWKFFIVCNYSDQTIACNYLLIAFFSHQIAYKLDKKLDDITYGPTQLPLGLRE